MSKIRKRYSADEKTKIVLEILKGEQTQSQITSKYGVHSTQLHSWKKQALASMSDGFGTKRAKESQSQEELIEELYKQIGQLKVELDWMKKNLNCSVEQRHSLVEANSTMSIRRQCELLGINRSGVYYKPVGVSSETVDLMHKIDELYTKHPYFGSRRMVKHLKPLGFVVNRKRIQRLYKQMGLEAVYPKPKLSQPAANHKKYPYLLRGVKIERSDQVWSTDITYVRLTRGFVYLMAIIDWYSRCVLDWELSISLEADFCIAALKRVLKQGRCEIFNTDQGSQFTSEGWTDELLAHDIQISMDGKGRALDNIFVERLWRSVKYESVYLSEWRTVPEARAGLSDYFQFYNHERLHQSLNYQTPWQVYQR